jgi:hypothetical protein
MPSSRRKIAPIAVAHRRQTLEEQSRFNAATDALLIEMVRQQLSRRSQ